MSERMMHGHQAAFLFAPFKHREVNNPQAGKLVLVAQSQLVAHFQTQLAQLLARLHRIVAAKDENQVARLRAEGFLHLLKHILAVELVDA